MHNRQLPGHRQYRALASRICQLRCRTPNQCDDTGGVDNTTLGLLVLSHAQDRVLASKPHAFHVDIMRQIPDLLWSVDSVGVINMHDSCVIEDYVDAAPGIEVGDHSLDVGFFGDVTFDGFEMGWIGKNFVGFCKSFGKSRLGDVGHEDRGSFTGEKDRCFEADTTEYGENWLEGKKGRIDVCFKELGVR